MLDPQNTDLNLLYAALIGSAALILQKVTPILIETIKSVFNSVSKKQELQTEISVREEKLDLDARSYLTAIAKESFEESKRISDLCRDELVKMQQMYTETMIEFVRLKGQYDINQMTMENFKSSLIKNEELVSQIPSLKIRITELETQLIITKKTHEIEIKNYQEKIAYLENQIINKKSIIEELRNKLQNYKERYADTNKLPMIETSEINMLPDSDTQNLIDKSQDTNSE